MGRKKAESLECVRESDKSKKRKSHEKFQSSEPRFQISITPQTENQLLFLKSLRKDTIVVGEGAPGVGKTILAVGHAIQQIALGNYERLVLCRAAVPTGKTMGFFPGDIYEKMLPWIQQMLTYAKQFAGANVVNTWMHGEHPKIILEPMETMRGRNFENTIVIVDEAQQLEFSEIKCLSTRIGQNTKMIFCGDLAQRDIKVSGLETFIKIVQRHEIASVGVTTFTVDDIVRSGIVRDLTIAYINEGV